MGLHGGCDTGPLSTINAAHPRPATGNMGAGLKGVSGFRGNRMHMVLYACVCQCVRGLRKPGVQVSD